MRLTLVVLLAFMSTTSLAAENKQVRVIDYYQQALTDYQRAINDLKAAQAEIKAVRDNAAKKVAKIDALIDKYEAALKITTKLIKDAYRQKLGAEAQLAEQARESAEDDAKATRAILDELGTSAEKVAKLTDAVSVKNGNVGIGTTPGVKLEVNGNIRLAHAEGLQKKGIYSKTFMVNGDANTYYPVAISTNTYGRVLNMQIWRGYHWTAPHTWNTATHKGNLVLELEMFGSTWNGGNMYRIKNFYQAYSQVISKITRPNPSGFWTVLWLRGGGAKYAIEGDFEGVQNPMVYYESTKISDYDNDAYDETVAPTTTVEQTFVNYSQNFAGKVGIGTNSPQYKLDVKGQVRADNVTVKSDQRHKQNIHSLKNALTKLQGLRGVSFKWKDNAQNADTQIGLIAQEVEKVLPELVSTDSEGYKSIAYGKLTAVLVEALKEQQLQIERLSNLIPDNNQK